MIDFSVPYQKDPGLVLKDGHQWHIDGQRAPGITEVLTYSGWINGGGDEAAMKHGEIVHLGCHWSLHPDFDFKAFGEKWPDQAPQVEAGMKALAFFGVKQGWSEIQVCDRRRHVATAIDFIGKLEDAIGTANFKTGEEVDWHAIQTAGEAAMFFKDDFYDLEQKTFRCTVKLQKDGTFNYDRDVRLYTDLRDFDLFDAACTTTEGMKRMGRGRPEPKYKAKKKDEPQVITVESSLFQPQAEKAGEGGLFG